MKKLLAIFFLLIFSCQVLPVKAIGKILAKNQLTEEVRHDSDNDDLAKDDLGKITKFDDDLFDEHHSFQSMASRMFFDKVLSYIIHQTEALPDDRASDIQSPPPDMA